MVYGSSYICATLKCKKKKQQSYETRMKHKKENEEEEEVKEVRKFGKVAHENLRNKFPTFSLFAYQHLSSRWLQNESKPNWWKCQNEMQTLSRPSAYMKCENVNEEEQKQEYEQKKP